MGQVLKLRTRRKRARYQMKRHDEAMRLRVTLDRYIEHERWHNQIKVAISRAVIGEAYNHARLGEAIVTLRGERPILVPLLQAVHRCDVGYRAYRDARDFFATLHKLSRSWARERRPVRHRKWRA